MYNNTILHVQTEIKLNSLSPQGWKCHTTVGYSLFILVLTVIFPLIFSRAGYGSESEADDEAATVTLASDLGRVNRASSKSAVKWPKYICFDIYCCGQVAQVYLLQSYNFLLLIFHELQTLKFNIVT